MSVEVYLLDGNVIIIYYSSNVGEYKISIFDINGNSQYNWVKANSCDDALERGYGEDHYREYTSDRFADAYEMCLYHGLDLTNSSLPDWFIENVMIEKLKE